MEVKGINVSLFRNYFTMTRGKNQCLCKIIKTKQNKILCKFIKEMIHEFFSLVIIIKKND